MDAFRLLLTNALQAALFGGYLFTAGVLLGAPPTFAGYFQCVALYIVARVAGVALFAGHFR